jgi:hypothetical protein
MAWGYPTQSAVLVPVAVVLGQVVRVVDDTHWIVEWAPVAAAVLAAVAAGASWRSVLLARRTQLDADRPLLASQLYRVANDPRLRLHIENIGSGTAKRVTFYGVAEGELAAGIAPETGLLRPGEGVTLLTNLTPTDPDSSELMTFCLDRENVIHTWSRRDHYERYRQPKRPRVMEWYFDRFYDGTDHDALTEQPWTVISSQ